MTSKLVVILGPTSSGKSSLAIKLAKKFNGEIVSADSRQVYKGMDIGSGKVGKRERELLPHHLLDIVPPRSRFTAGRYKKLAFAAVSKIQKKNKLPFLVGGTAFYIYSVIDDLQIPEVAPNLKLRRALEKKTTKELVIILRNLDPKRAKTIDKHNRMRLIRAVEINVFTGKPVPSITVRPNKAREGILILGIKKSPAALRRLINKRVKQRFEQGLIKEVKKLFKIASPNRLRQIGLTYGIVAEHIRRKLPLNETVEKVKQAEWQLARRQMTWFKRDKRIHWIENQKQAEGLVKNFLNKKSSKTRAQ